MSKLVYQLHDLMNLRHDYYYDIQLKDLLPRQRQVNKRQQSPQMVTWDYKSGKIIPVSAFILLQLDNKSSNMQTSPDMYPPIWSPPISSIPSTFPSTFQYPDYTFQGVMVPVINIDQELSAQCKFSPSEKHHPHYASPAWYNSPISPSVATLSKANKDKDVELAKCSDVSSGDDTSSDDILIQIHSSNLKKGDSPGSRV